MCKAETGILLSTSSRYIGCRMGDITVMMMVTMAMEPSMDLIVLCGDDIYLWDVVIHLFS